MSYENKNIYKELLEKQVIYIINIISKFLQIHDKQDYNSKTINPASNKNNQSLDFNPCNYITYL